MKEHFEFVLAVGAGLLLAMLANYIAAAATDKTITGFLSGGRVA